MLGVFLIANCVAVFFLCKRRRKERNVVKVDINDTYSDYYANPNAVVEMIDTNDYYVGDNDYEEWRDFLEEYHPPPYNLPNHQPALSFGVAGSGSGVPFHTHGYCVRTPTTFYCILLVRALLKLSTAGSDGSSLLRTTNQTSTPTGQLCSGCRRTTRE